MDDHGEQERLWFGEDTASSEPHAHGRRTVGIALISLVCVAAVAVPVGLTLSSGSAPPALPKVAQKQVPSHLPQGQAQRQVLAALSATTSSGSFNVTYEFDPATPPTATTTTTTTPCSSAGVDLVLPSRDSASNAGADMPGGEMPGGCIIEGGSGDPEVSVQGQGTIDTSPFAMVATSNVTGLGLITLRENGTDIWEIGGGDYGLSPGSSDDGPGQSLSGFAGLVEGTLGQRQGALAMGGLSSPTGYLDLDQSMITGADQIGTGTVDGTAVTIYQLDITPAQEANVPRETAEESKAVTAANAVLAAQGYTGTTVLVSIDASGYIRQTRSTAHFSDGSTSVSQSIFSDFGCAGTVLMPGQTGATAPPAGCVSPDTGMAPTTTTTTTAPPASTTSTVPPASTTSTTSTTLPPASTTTTTTTTTPG